MVTAYLLLNVETGAETKIADELKKKKIIKDLNIVYGEHDLIVKVKVDTMTKLKEFIFELRKNNKSIKSSSTLISTAE